jgi:hypothetical protein
VALINKLPFKKVTYQPIVYNNNPNARVMVCITWKVSRCNGDPYDCGGSICGFDSFEACVGSSGGGGEYSSGTGVSWGGGGTSSGAGTNTTPVGGGGSSTPATNATRLYNSFSTTSIFNERGFLSSLSSDANTVLINFLNNNPYPSATTNSIKSFITSLCSNTNNSDWFTAQSPATQVAIFNYLVQNNFNAPSRSFVNWATNYLIANPTVTFQQFQNWFMGTTEGDDGTYDSAYWSNPSLTFPPQNLPTLVNFKNACPSKYDNAQTVCTNIGGNVLVMYNAVVAQNKKLNTCAIRISKALNYSGVVVPALPDNPNGTKNSITGADGKNYIINAKALNSWMRKTFGTSPSNYKHFTSSQGGVKGENFPALLANFNGIYSMVTPSSIHPTWGTGHADLLENGGCLLNCHFYDSNNNFVPVDFIDVWILP